MPRVLIAGCGYVGCATADLFQRSGWAVEGWTSSPESATALSGKSFPVRAVDLTSGEAVAAAATPQDAIIHCASSGGGGAEQYNRIYLQGVRNLAAAFPHTLLLFTSSTSVYAQSASEWVTEESPAEPQRETGRILRAAEDFVLARKGVVSRLSGIYGPGRSALLEKVLRGEGVSPGRDRYLNQVHRDDIASALHLLVTQAVENAESESTAGAIFNVSDGNPLSRREAVEWLAARLQRALTAPTTASENRKRGDSNKRVSNAKLRALGWSPRYPTFQSAMTESILPASSV